MSTRSAREETVLEAILPRYVAEGFTVIRHPSSDVLPKFMGSYRPDAVALRPDKKIAIEIKAKGPGSKEGPTRIEDLFSGHSDWEFRVYYAPGYAEENPLRAPALSEIDSFVKEAGNLRNTGHLAAAVMTAWATLEAAGRILAPERLARPQPPVQLVEALASDGHVSPSEADTLRGISEVRNAVVHGELGAAVTPERVDQLLRIVRRVVKSLSRSPTTSDE
jgi:uncharacterized protein YutE (UPF0331/DUF86 family)